jgi:hypothetical protein
MIKKILLRSSVALLTFYIALIVTLPKSEIWYKIESELYKNRVVVDGETLNETLTTLNVENGNVLFEALSIANFDKKSLFLTLLYNQISVKNLQLGEDTASFKDFFFEDLYITHSIISPMVLSLSGHGNFGELKGRFNLETKQIDLLVQPSDRLKKERTVMKHLKKHEKGYIYNAKF